MISLAFASASPQNAKIFHLAGKLRSTIFRIFAGLLPTSTAMFVLRSFLLLYLYAYCLSACGPLGEERLPILGERLIQEKEIDGKTVIDTLYHRIPPFEFVNQDSQKVSQTTFEGKIYVSDFFFTTCPTICPKMKSQLLRIYEKYLDDERVLILSHSVDIVHDSVPVLKDYAERLGIKSSKWHLVTGSEEAIYDMAGHYLLAAQKDEEALGGYDHSGQFMLIDTNRHIRATCDGTNPEDVNRFMKDIDRLLAEQFPKTKP